MKSTTNAKAIYTPKVGKVMSVIVFASGGGGNLKAAINLSLKKHHLLKVALVVTDRLNIPAIDIAAAYGIPVLAYDFEKECGRWADCKSDRKKSQNYQKAATKFHDNVLEKIRALERENNTPFDLVVLSYHRWIHGKLLDYFAGRIINQHAGDLTVMLDSDVKVRKYRGINPVLMALTAGERKTRTSTFLVRNNHDGGEILCQGPWVEYTETYPVTKKTAWDHEVIQKKESDWPSLTFALTEIAQGHFGVAAKKHSDQCHIITYKEKPLPYGGVDLAHFKDIL